MTDLMDVAAGAEAGRRAAWAKYYEARRVLAEVQSALIDGRIGDPRRLVCRVDMALAAIDALVPLEVLDRESSELHGCNLDCREMCDGERAQWRKERVDELGPRTPPTGGIIGDQYIQVEEGRGRSLRIGVAYDPERVVVYDVRKP